MPRRKLYRMVKGAFVYLYLDLVLLVLWVPAAVRLWKQPAAWLLLALWAVNFTLALWAKGRLLLDLLEGRTETLRCRISHRENGGSLRCVRVEYLVEEGEAPRRFVLFPEALPLPPETARRLLHGTAALCCLPRSLTVVGVEETGEEAPPPERRTREWYRQKPRLEEEYRQMNRLRPCRLRDDYWLWELIPTLLLLSLAVLYVLSRLL